MNTSISCGIVLTRTENGMVVSFYCETWIGVGKILVSLLHERSAGRRSDDAFFVYKTSTDRGFVVLLFSMNMYWCAIMVEMFFP